MDVRDEDKVDREAQAALDAARAADDRARDGGGGVTADDIVDDEDDHDPRRDAPITSIDLDAPGMSRPEGVAERIEDMSAPDGAAVMERMPSEMSADVAEALDPE